MHCNIEWCLGYCMVSLYTTINLTSRSIAIDLTAMTAIQIFIGSPLGYEGCTAPRPEDERIHAATSCNTSTTVYWGPLGDEGFTATVTGNKRVHEDVGGYERPSGKYRMTACILVSLMQSCMLYA